MKLSRRSLTTIATATPLLINQSVGAQGTPVSHTTLASAKDALNGMARFIPEDVPDDLLNLSWTNFQRQLFAMRSHVGAAADEVEDFDLLATSNFAAGPDFLMYATRLPEVAGYALEDIIQASQFGVPPASTTLVHLNMELESIIPLWESYEYEERENEYGTFWTIGEEPSIDLQNPIQRVMMARFNNVTILPQNMLAYSSSAVGLELIMATAAGDTQGSVERLAARTSSMPEEATSTWFTDASLISLPAMVDMGGLMEQGKDLAGEALAESDDAVGEMPLFKTLTIGATEGGSINEEWSNQDAYQFLMLETANPDDAQRATEVIQWRVENLTSLSNGSPYSEILPEFETEVRDEGLVFCRAAITGPGSSFMRMIQSGDALPFAMPV